VTELPWLESAVEGTVNHADDTFNWTDGWRSMLNPRSWIGG
jgi:hypothetical protein